MAQGPDRTLKKGDTYPPLIRALEDEGGPLNLSTATSVRFLARKDNTLIVATCTVTTIAAAKATGFLIGTWADESITAAVTWTIVTGDTSIAGTYKFEYEITWPNGKIETVPNAAAANPVLQIDADND